MLKHRTSAARQSFGRQQPLLRNTLAGDNRPGLRQIAVSRHVARRHTSYSWGICVCLVAAVLLSGAAPPSQATSDTTVIVNWGGDYVTTDTAMARYITVE